jgi:hypothetical protein
MAKPKAPQYSAGQGANDRKSTELPEAKCTDITSHKIIAACVPSQHAKTEASKNLKTNMKIILEQA